MNHPTTLVTGSSRGIGHFLASHYLERGHRVIGVSRGPCDLNHDRYVHFEGDLANENRVRQIFAEIDARFGAIENLINNAGISSLNHSLLTPLQTAKSIFDVNFFGTYLACQEAVRLMRKNRRGRIVNFSSIAVKMASEGLSAYAASKAAVEQLTLILAKELGSFGITVNCVAPSFVETDLSKNIPTEHRGHRNEMADIVRAVEDFLAGEKTGEIVYL
jgi:3-oxoacyl-[acyl-carrier protein] reductase